MVTQTSLMAQKVRIQQWAEQIRECQNRPKGMAVETWCAQNNLTKANYYYRLRRVREVCLEQFQAAETPAFVELPVSEKEMVCAESATETNITEKAGPILRMKSISGFCIEVFSDISPTLLRQVIEAMNHAE